MRRPAAGSVLGRVVVLVLVICLAAACTVNTAGNPHRTRSSSLSPVDAAPNPLGVKWIPTPRTMPQPYLRQLAGGTTWDQAVWCDVEPRRGRWDWTALDAAVQRAHGLGFTLMLKIRVGACWATRQGPSHRRGVKGVTESRMPTSLSEYASFVRAVVSRYGPMGVNEYAIENEPDTDWFWAGTVGQLETLTRRAVEAVRTADSKARVASWGISSESYGIGVISRLLREHKSSEAIADYSTYFAHRGTYPPVRSEADLQRFLARAAARRDLVYLRAEQRLLADHVFDVRQVHFYETWQSVPALMWYLHATTPRSVPIEVWEAGQFWRGGPSDASERANQVVKTVALLLAGGASLVIWLPLTNDPERLGGGEELWYGLLAPGGHRREAAVAFRQLVRWSAGTSGLPVAVSGGQGVAFRHGPETWLVVWSDGGRATVARPEGTAGAWDVSGRALRWPSTGLRVGPDPLFVKVDTRASGAVTLFSQ